LINCFRGNLRGADGSKFLKRLDKLAELCFDSLTQQKFYLEEEAMKKLILVVAVAVLSLTVVGSAFAQAKGGPYGSGGCGLGGMVIGSDPGMIQLVATFLNGICGNQTFGITSGTLGCEKPIRAAKNDRLNEFVVANMDNLAADIAKGSGETLDTLAELMQVPAKGRPALYSKLQANFGSIFTSENVVFANVVDNVMIVAAN